MNWQTIFNPFSKFSEKTLLFFGIIIMLIGSFFGSFLGISYDGVFDAHQAKITFLESLSENLINVFSVFVVLFILGKIIYSKTRFIDVLNTALVYRFPIYLVAFFASSPILTKIGKEIDKNSAHLEKFQLKPLDLTIVLGISMVMMLFLAYSIVLLTNGFRTASNVKKWQHYVFFAIALVVAEIISKSLIQIF